MPAVRAAAVLGQAIGSWVVKAAIPEMIAMIFGPEDPTADETWCHAPTKLQHAVVVGQLVSRLALHMAKLGTSSTLDSVFMC